MAERVRVREISNEEGNRLLRIVRRSSCSVVKWRRAQMVLLSASIRDTRDVPGYDFRSLSDHDFESLARDLISAKVGLSLEIFAPGPDGGIDLRHLAPEDEHLIVQCKHYVGSGFDKLLAAMRGELPKIVAMEPDRYCLATSVPLSPDRKNKLLAALAPFILGPGDIWGQDDLNALLRENPEIERAHFKLWLTSAAVLGAFLNANVIGRSDDLLEDMPQKVKLYVQNESFPAAQQILSEYHTCIVSGEPGIGKTTLAEMILVDHATRGYQVVVVSEDIDEAERIFSTGTSQIFYYDDFLGQASTAEKLGKNEDSRLTSFIRRIQKTRNKRLVLTTREYMLQAAKLGYEKLHQAELDVFKYVLDLGAYTRLERARILYNHLHFSTLPPDDIRSILKDERYRKVIDHRNYSPRIIDHVVKLARTQQGDHDFAAFLLENLDRPERIWRHAFENQLNATGRAILLTLVTMPATVFVESLKRATLAYLPGMGTTEFKASLKILEGTFTRTQLTAGNTTISFENASLRDFLLLHLGENPDVLARILRTAEFFDQCEFFGRLVQSPFGVRTDLREAIAATVRTHRAEFAAAYKRTFQSPSAQVEEARIFGRGSITLSKTINYEQRAIDILSQLALDIDDAWLTKSFSFLAGRWLAHQGSKSTLVELLKQVDRFEDGSRVIMMPFLAAGKKWLLDRPQDSYDYELAFRATRYLPEIFTTMEVVNIIDAFRIHHEEELDRLYDYGDDEFIEHLEGLKSAVRAFGFERDDRMDDAEERASDLLNQGEDTEDDDRRGSYRQERGDEDREIDALFSFFTP